MGNLAESFKTATAPAMRQEDAFGEVQVREKVNLLILHEGSSVEIPFTEDVR